MLNGLRNKTNILQPILFRMYDRKDYSNYIWKLLKPEYKLL